MSRIEVADGVCLRRPGPTQGSRADDDDESTLCTIPKKRTKFSFAAVFMMQTM
jgi:hypothetical protein